MTSRPSMEDFKAADDAGKIRIILEDLTLWRGFTPETSLEEFTPLTEIRRAAKYIHWLLDEYMAQETA